MELPGTTRPPLETSTMDVNLSTVEANFADALACKPLALITLSFRILVFL